MVNIPQYIESNYTHFKVDLSTVRESGDDMWFELMDDDNNSRIFSSVDFHKLKSNEPPLTQPTLLKIHSTPAMKVPAGGTVIKSIFWTTNDPKSWNTGTQRVVRDNHYAENLQTLSTRNFETPATANATTGFRLVRRP